MHSDLGRLLDTLTRALQSSGVDLSQANISVQIDLGKNATVAAADTSTKVNSLEDLWGTSFVHFSNGLLEPDVVCNVEAVICRAKKRYGL